MSDEVSVAQRTKSLYDLGNPATMQAFWSTPASAKLVLFHANFCGYCKDPRSAFCQLAPPLRNGPTSVLFGLVEMAYKAPVEAITGVTANGFPTMALFNGNNQRIQMMRSRTAPAIITELDTAVPAAMADPSMQYVRSLRFPQRSGGGTSAVPCMQPVSAAPPRRMMVRPWPAAVEQAQRQQPKPAETVVAVEPRFFHRPVPTVDRPLFDGRIGGRGPKQPLFRQVRFGGSTDVEPAKPSSSSSSVGGSADAGKAATTAAATAGGTKPQPTDESAVRAALIAAHGEAPARLAKTAPMQIPVDMTTQQLAAWRARRASRAAGARKAQQDAADAAKKAAGAAYDGGCVVM